MWTVEMELARNARPTITVDDDRTVDPETIPEWLLPPEPPVEVRSSDVYEVQDD